MSAELYDAEMAGALARPAVDVLPTHHARKTKADEPVAETAVSFEPPVAAEPVEPPSAELADSDPVDTLDPRDTVEDNTEAHQAAAVPVADEHVPLKVFGLTLGRRRPKASAPAEEADGIETTSAETTSAETTIDELVLPDEIPEPVVDTTDSADEADEADSAGPTVGAEAAEAAPTHEIVALASTMPDHTEEIRAMRSLLEASEQVRQAAEARTAAAEAQLRTVTNSVQEWQIRHREAESTISELAASLAGAEGRMAELHQQLHAVQAERDELHSQLDAFTSPSTS